MHRRSVLTGLGAALVLGGCNQVRPSTQTGTRTVTPTPTPHDYERFHDDVGEPPWGEADEVDNLLTNETDESQHLDLQIDSRVYEPSPPKRFYLQSFRLAPQASVLLADAFTADEPLKVDVLPDGDANELVRAIGHGEEQAVLVTVSQSLEWTVSIVSGTS